MFDLVGMEFNINLGFSLTECMMLMTFKSTKTIPTTFNCGYVPWSSSVDRSSHLGYEEAHQIT